jgi:hypothetical protein
VLHDKLWEEYELCGRILVCFQGCLPGRRRASLVIDAARQCEVEVVLPRSFFQAWIHFVFLKQRDLSFAVVLEDFPCALYRLHAGDAKVSVLMDLEIQDAAERYAGAVVLRKGDALPAHEFQRIRCVARADASRCLVYSKAA